MRIFIYEYTCAAQNRAAISASLQTEGRAMLTAIAYDFARIPGVEVVGLLHPQSGLESDPSGCQWVRSEAEGQAFRALARTADHSIIIAPEFDDLLTTRCRWVVEEGGNLLGPSLDAVRLTSDKLTLSLHLRAHSVPTPASHLSNAGVDFNAFGGPAVCKPRHGAGSQGTFLVNSADDLTASLALFRREISHDHAILQPFVPGLPASVGFLIGPRAAIPLPPATQHLSPDGRFTYLGGSLPLAPALAARAVQLGSKAIEAVPGLRGYTGVDLVLGPADDGSADQVIEINPRLTTSYIGLRALAASNLAQALLNVVTGREAGRIAYHISQVRFLADGTVWSTNMHGPWITSLPWSLAGPQ
jgi:predicted ATP-grasp superfamily ATP-dependent carboligase